MSLPLPSRFPAAAGVRLPQTRAGRAIGTVVDRLRDLREGPVAVDEIVRRGDEAVASLEAFLRGPSESVPQPRCLAADALGAIGGPAAMDVLLRALENSSDRRLDDVLRLAEDAVSNRIAENLSRLGGESVANALLEALRRRPLAACAEGLGRLRDARAVPRLVECLEDDFARESAKGALVAIGEASVLPLARKLLYGDQTGPESSVRVASCVAAVEALAAVGGGEVVEVLAAALSHAQETVRIASALALGGSQEHALRGIPVLVEALGRVPFDVRNRVAGALEALGERAENALLPVVCGIPRSEPELLRSIDAVAILGRMKSTKAVEPLAGLRDRPDVRLRIAAVAALTQIPDAAATLSMGLFLTDPDARVRHRAVAALAERGAPAARALSRALGDADRGVRKAARSALLAMGEAAVPGLLEARECARHSADSPSSRWRIRRQARRLARRLRRDA